MSISPGKDRNMIGALQRAMRKTWFGEGQPVEEMAQAVLMDNGEFLPTPNAAGTGMVPTVGVGGLLDLAHIPIATPVTYCCASNAQMGTTRFFVSDSYYRVSNIRFTYATAGTSASIAIQVTKDPVGNTSATAPGAGAPLLQTAFDGVNTTINKTITGTLVTGNALWLNPGDSLSVLFTGTLTTIAGVTITVDLVNTCTVNFAGTPAYQPPLQSPLGKTVPANVSQFYVRLNAETNTQVFYLANRDMTIVAAYATIVTGFAASTTIDLTKDTGTQAAGAGSSILAAPMDATQVGELLVPGMNLTANRLLMAAGDRLSIKYSGTVTGAGVCITIVFGALYERLEISLPIGLFSADKAAQTFFIANRYYEVVDVSTVYGTAAGSASGASVTIDKILAIPGSGNLVQTAGFDFTATANTVQVATLNTLRNRLMSQGDRLGLNVTGAAMPNNTCITVSLRPWA